MIKFSCHCSHRFAVSDGEAGGTIQCPACARLNDIPALDDLPNLSDDGTFLVGGREVAPPKYDRLGQLMYVYQKDRVDDDGNEIDLRVTAADLVDDIEPIPMAEAPAPSPRRTSPRYDPETGELIRPIAIKSDPARDARPVIPMAMAVKTLGYANGSGGDYAIKPGHIAAEVLRPINLVVMACILLMHIIFNVCLLTVLSGILIVLLAPVIMAIVLISHYGNVIDDIGTEGANELPRPLRNVNLHDDIWAPFSQVFGSLGLCFMPVVLMLASGALMHEVPPIVWGSLAVAFGALGIYFFPAVLLTFCTSGTILNLRPDRVRSVIRQCGSLYPIMVMTALIGIPVYGAGMIGTFLSLMSSIGVLVVANAGPLEYGTVAYPLLAAGIYLAHVFCVQLGVAYRTHHEAFPWVLQRFTGSSKAARSAEETRLLVERKRREAQAAALRQLDSIEG